MQLLSESEAITKTKAVFSTHDPGLVEKIVKDCYGKPLYFIKDHVSNSLTDIKFAFPGNELYQEGFWSGYLYALIGKIEE
jgi:hypothetical protein